MRCMTSNVCPLLAPVLVDRHRFTKYSFDALALSRRECQAGTPRGPSTIRAVPSDDVVTMDKIVSLCKRRGFVFPSSEIYGGLGLELRLRPLRRAAEEQRQGPVVARDAPGARRHRRAGLGDHPAPDDLAGQRAPGRVHRPPGRLPHLQAAIPRRPPRPVGLRAQAVQAPRRDARLRSDRGPRLQPDVRDHDRAGQGGGLDRLPAPRDRAGDLPELQELPAVLP